MYKTDIKKATLRPVWEETVDIPLDENLLDKESLSLHVFDYDLVGRNSSLGDFTFNIRDLKTQWVFSNWIPLKDVTSGKLRATLLFKDSWNDEGSSSSSSKNLETLQNQIDYQRKGKIFFKNHMHLEPNSHECLKQDYQIIRTHFYFEMAIINVFMLAFRRCIDQIFFFRGRHSFLGTIGKVS